MSFEKPTEYNAEANAERELTPAEKAVYYNTEKALMREYILGLHIAPPPEDDKEAEAQHHALIQKYMIDWIDTHGPTYRTAFIGLADRDPSFTNQCQEDPQSVISMLDEEIASIESARMAA